MRPFRPPTAIGAALAALTAATIVSIAPASPTGAIGTPSLPAPDSHGIDASSTLTPVRHLSDRLFEATMVTPAIHQPRGATTPANVSVPVKVRILLPAGYDADRAEGYDVLYLLHGGGGDWLQWSVRRDWTGQLGGAVADTIPDHPGIVVMPEGGKAGWYTDWAGSTDGNFAPQWETFHVDQLVPWIDANFNTAGTRDSRAIAGLSMGGLGALRYAAHHTDVFGAIGAFSAGTTLDHAEAWDIVNRSMLGFGATIVNTGLLDGHFRVNPPWPGGGHESDVRYRMEAVFGPAESAADPDLDQDRWIAESPAGGLADEYEAYDGRMAVYSGGIDEHGRPDTGGEFGIGEWNIALHAALVGRGIDHRWCGGDGDHDMASWRTYLADFVEYLDDPVTGGCPNPPTVG